MLGHRRPKKPARMADWHKADIKAALEKNGFSLRGLAKHHDVSPSTINQALSSRYPKSEQRIAAAIRVPAATIWPSRYPGRTPNRRNSRRAQVSRKRLSDRSTAPRGGLGKGTGLN